MSTVALIQVLYMVDQEFLATAYFEDDKNAGEDKEDRGRKTVLPRGELS